ncbi:bestrophin family protein [Mangrovimonas aestuarii]|uniref:bestrophin family protein n=1 Tax=Mangrovimonas aestuarii TaxID=3018443 RepID=UPI0023781A60|nr:bestrophin family ion channel [Mangrovimonas aestuarii]
MTFNWSKRPFFIGLVYALILFYTVFLFKLNFEIPWQPIGVIGIAVAFYLGFKNNSSYDRAWEARKIWGSIVNNSRTFGAATVAFVQGDDAHKIQKELIYRHIAWLTALRHQLRLSREWEHIENRLQGLYAPKVCEDYTNRLEDELESFLSNKELRIMEGSSNMATQILRIQSERLQELKNLRYFEDFRHMEFHHLVQSFYEDQGKSERIKNFPFPRQYASTAYWLCFIFCLFVPFGLLDIFKLENYWVYWLGPVLSAVIIWVFFLMEKIGDYSENPFEGTYNDVPITAIARGIEIDIREMINDTDIPKPVEPENGFLM